MRPGEQEEIDPEGLGKGDIEMEIKIRTEGNFASMEIDGRKLEIIHGPISNELIGLKGEEYNSTIGGMVASSLFDAIGKLLEVLAESEVEYSTWDTLSEDDADWAYDRLG